MQVRQVLAIDDQNVSHDFTPVAPVAAGPTGPNTSKYSAAVEEVQVSSLSCLE